MAIAGRIVLRRTLLNHNLLTGAYSFRQRQISLWLKPLLAPVVVPHLFWAHGIAVTRVHGMDESRVRLPLGPGLSAGRAGFPPEADHIG